MRAWWLAYRGAVLISAFFLAASLAYVLFFTGPERDLLRCTIWKLLTPEMRAAANGRAEVHPLAIRRPGGRRAGTRGADLPASGAAIKWKEAARLTEREGLVHLDGKNRLAIRRRVRVMHHAALVVRQVEAGQIGHESVRRQGR